MVIYIYEKPEIHFHNLKYINFRKQKFYTIYLPAFSNKIQILLFFGFLLVSRIKINLFSFDLFHGKAWQKSMIIHRGASQPGILISGGGTPGLNGEICTTHFTIHDASI